MSKICRDTNELDTLAKLTDRQHYEIRQTVGTKNAKVDCFT